MTSPDVGGTGSAGPVFAHGACWRSRELAILAALIVAGFLLRVVWVGAAPLHPDEFHYAFNTMAAEETASWSAIRDLDTRFLIERRTAHPLAWSVITRWLWFLPLGWAFPWSPGFLRMPNVVVGTLLIPTAWGIGRVVANRRQALVAALFVAVCPGLVWISRTLYQDSAFTLWIALMLLGGALLLKRESRWPAALVGVGMGLVLATKVSGPMLLPAFVLLALVGPMRVTLSKRMTGFAIAALLAIGVFIIFCDPAAYWEAIRQPSDPRYEGSISLAYAERIFVGDFDVLLNILSLDLPVTLLLCLLAGALAWRDSRALFPVILVVMLVCLTPLILLHMPPLSGPHGFAPIYFVLILLGLPVMEMRPRPGVIALLALHGMLSLGLVLARETGGLDRHYRGGVYPPRSSIYDALRGELHQRHQPRQILLFCDEIDFMRFHGVIRLAELTEGAIILCPAFQERELSTDAMSLADLIIVQEGFLASPSIIEGDFARSRTFEGLEVWKRTVGEARSDFAVSDLVQVDAGTKLLPGGLRLVAGRIAVNGAVLPRTLQSEAPVTMDGRVNFADWGSGTIRIGEEMSDVRLSLVSPLMDDVFWDY